MAGVIATTIGILFISIFGMVENKECKDDELRMVTFDSVQCVSDNDSGLRQLRSQPKPYDRTRARDRAISAGNGR